MLPNLFPVFRSKSHSVDHDNVGGTITPYDCQKDMSKNNFEPLSSL